MAQDLIKKWINGLENKQRIYAKRLLQYGPDAEKPEGLTRHYAFLVKYNLTEAIKKQGDNKCYVNFLSRLESDKIYSENNGLGIKCLCKILKKKSQGGAPGDCSGGYSIYQ